MKIFHSRAAASLAAIAVLSMTATPVLAHGPDRWHRHHRGGGIDGSDLLTGLLLVGGAAVIASAVTAKTAKPPADDSQPYHYPGNSSEGEGQYGDAPADAPYDGAEDRGTAAYPGGPVDGDVRDDASRDVGAGSGSFGAAVDACSAELERGQKHVDSVDSVRRMGARYSVEGKLEDGRPYACSVDDGGHIRSVAVDGHGMI